MFIDGSQVVVSNRTQRGRLFSERGSLCKDLIVGGDDTTERYFRGIVDEVRVWPRALSANEIYGLLRENVSASAGHSLHETFSNLDAWQMLKSHAPNIVHSDLDPNRHDVRVAPPPCGVTVCDDPDVVLSYATHPQLRRTKTVRYRIINVRLDNRSFPTVTNSQIRLQHDALNEAFRPYNISWEKEEVNVRNTSLRLKTIILGCDASKVGDGRCDEECRHTRTGNDGGDCDQERVGIFSSHFLFFVVSYLPKYLLFSSHVYGTANSRVLLILQMFDCFSFLAKPE